MQRLAYQFRFICALLVLSGIVLTSLLPVAAATKATSKTPSTTTSSSAAPTTITEQVTQSYSAASGVQTGMIVELAKKPANTVMPLTAADMTHMLGVVIPASSATITLTPATASQQQVLIADSGEYDVVVSNQNGPIKIGDYLTVSAINGVAMEADQNELEIVGKAAAAFNGKANVIGNLKLTSVAGKSQTVSLGRIPVDISISHNPLYEKSADYVPGFLAKIAVSVASHPVSVARIYMSMAVLAITAVVTSNMLYSGVRSGMIAVGRNPLSKKSIIRSLIQTVIAGLIIFIVGILAVYLLLKL